MRGSLVEDAVRAWLAQTAGAVGVAVSGGADSMALAHAVWVHAPSRLELVHVDHGLRADSGTVARAVQRYWQRRRVTCHRVTVEVEAGASIEAAARTARHAAFADLVRVRGWTALALAHTEDDQAETVLMRLLRGTGPAGLAAMAPVRGALHRPLLAVTRAATHAYVRAHRLRIWPDAMNADPRFTRVRIRQAVWPVLTAETPRLNQRLSELADRARDWLDALAPLAAALHDDAKALAMAPKAVAALALARLAEAAGMSLEQAHVRAILEQCGRGGRARRVDVPGGMAWIEQGRVRFEVCRSASIAGPPHAAGPDGPYLIRQVAPGDRMRPIRRGGRSRKLSDLLAEAKVPLAARPHAWVVLDRTGEVVWAEFIGAATGRTIAVTPSPGKSK